MTLPLPSEDRASSFGDFARAFRNGPNPFAGPTFQETESDSTSLIWAGRNITPTGSNFLKFVYQSGWIDMHADWVAWKQSTEATYHRNSLAEIANADERIVKLLLTVIVRQDRFVDRTLSDAFDSGLLVATVERADALSKQPR